MRLAIVVSFSLLSHGSNAASAQDWGVAAGEVAYPSYMAEKLMKGECRRHFKKPHNSAGDIHKLLSEVPVALRPAATRQLTPEALEASTVQLSKQLETQYPIISSTESAGPLICGMRVGAMLGLRHRAMAAWEAMVTFERTSTVTLPSAPRASPSAADTCHDSGTLASNVALARATGRPLSETIGLVVQIPDPDLRKEWEAMIIDVYTSRLTADAAYMKYRDQCQRR